MSVHHLTRFSLFESFLLRQFLLALALILLVGCNNKDSGNNILFNSLYLQSPTSLYLVTPDSSPGLNSTPTIRVEGVLSGTTVKLFTDSTCTTEVASALSVGTSVDITLGSALLEGQHTFYANVTDLHSSSDCSKASVSYNLLSCPEGFIFVPHNTEVGISKDFCVMKYEAKNDGTDGVISAAVGDPYVGLSIEESQQKCQDLGAGNEVVGQFDLISNAEWMTIARNAESVPSNFQGGVMARGWSASKSYGDTWTNSGVAPLTGSSCLYNTESNTCDSTGEHLYKRTLTLTSGEEIWDFSGNVWEWVDWDLSPGVQLGPTNCAASVITFSNVVNLSCYTNGDLLDNQIFPASLNESYPEGMGRFVGGEDGAVLRGGAWTGGQNSGAFTIHFGGPSSLSDDRFGFRCVYRL